MTAIAHPITQADLLQQRFARLRENGEQHFDPPRFRVLELLWQRSNEQRENVRKILLDKFQLALDAYIRDCEQSRSQAEQQLQTFTSHPDRQQLQDLFQDCDYNGVLRLARRFQARESLSKGKRSLASLTRQLSNMKLTKSDQADANPFENLLLQQDQEALANLNGFETDATDSTQRPVRGLAAGRHLQILIRKHHEDTLISQALLRAPEDPGPLNAHKLLISALSTMRELSPKYVSRFAAYGENLLWLEEMDRRESTNTKNKPKS